jgi:hypothetical protein
VSIGNCEEKSECKNSVSDEESVLELS